MNWTEVIRFFQFSDYNVRIVVIGTVLLSALSGWIGTFTYLRKQALTGDAVAHSVLPGICIAFLLSSQRDPLILLVGGLVSGLLSMILMEALQRKRVLKMDAALAFMLSFFFGLGIVLLTMIQHRGNAAQAGLDRFLLGKAASINLADVQILLFSFALIGLILIVFHRGFVMLAFDESFSTVIGFPSKTLRFLFAVILTWVICLGIQAVGVVLMSALLIIPPLTARLWTNNIRVMILLSIALGVLSGFCGAFISFLAPSMPTGPWIVVTASGMAAFSFIFSPERGLFARFIQKRNQKFVRSKENCLKLFYQAEERQKTEVLLTKFDLAERFNSSSFMLNRALKILLHEGLILRQGSHWMMTSKGRLEAGRIVRLHRLWEVYLQRYLHLEPDHVHEDADAIEHVITPELEKQLAAELGNPSTDPHLAVIPPPRYD